MSTLEDRRYDVKEEAQYAWALDQYNSAAYHAADQVHWKRCQGRQWGQRVGHLTHECPLVPIVRQRLFEAALDLGEDQMLRFVGRWAA